MPSRQGERESSRAPGKADGAGEGDGGHTLTVKRVLPSYVQVAEQLRDAILRNEVASGDRLPSEAELVQLFGVGRSTVREALRLLASEGLLVSKRGVNGGTFILRPDTSQVEDFLGTSLGRLTSSSQLTIEEILEAWELLEPPVAELAARRRTDHQAETLEHLSMVPVKAGRETSVAEASSQFHAVLFEASRNRLLPVVNRPLATVARSLLKQTVPTTEFWRRIQREHLSIAEAVVAKDAGAARETMLRHVRTLVSWYTPA